VIQCNLIPILSKTTAVSGRGMSPVRRETSLDYHRPAPLNSNKNAALAAVAGFRTLDNPNSRSATSLLG
jgi:hypothetical protein